MFASRFLFGEEFVRRMQAANLLRTELDPEVTAYVMGMISFGMVSILQLSPRVPAPSLDRLAAALADLVDRGLTSHVNDKTLSANAGKHAFRHLVDETKQLYAERAEAVSGSHPHSRS